MKHFQLLAIPVLLLFAKPAASQSLEDGRNFMYYERFTSAKAVFQKLVNESSDNAEAVYWLGQAIMAAGDQSAKDVAAAKQLYLSFLGKNPNSPLVMAGVGQMELLEGKLQDARSHFETAISLSQGKNIAVLNAIGFANGNPNSKNGDAAYAVDKLKLATQIKGMKDPDVWVNLGDAYRKFADGGNAIQAYQTALTLNPNYARAIYRIGRVYESQGLVQKDIFLKNYEEAIQKDPKYAPAYSTLFNFYYENNPSEATHYLNKMLEYSDQDQKACYYKALIEYRQSNFSQAVAKSRQCIQEEGAGVYPNVYGLLALAYNRLGDSVKVREYFEQYFKIQSPEKIGSGDYAIYASNLLKFPGMEQEAGKWIEKAVEMDSIEANKVGYLKSMAAAYEARKQFKDAAVWYEKILSVKDNYLKTDLYNAGYSYFRSGLYPQAIAVFNKYVDKFPNDIFGYYMIAKSNAGIDTTATLGLAVPFYEKAIQVGQADSIKNKDKLVGAYKYLTEYYYNIRKAQDTALIFIDKAIILTPDDEELKKVREIIKNTDPAQKKKAPQATSPR